MKPQFKLLLLFLLIGAGAMAQDQQNSQIGAKILPTGEKGLQAMSSRFGGRHGGITETAELQQLQILDLFGFGLHEVFDQCTWLGHHRAEPYVEAGFEFFQNRVGCYDLVFPCAVRYAFHGNSESGTL